MLNKMARPPCARCSVYWDGRGKPPRSRTWEVSLWGKNITDTRYLVVASDLTPFYASPAEYFSPAGNKMFAGDWNPRGMLGLSVTFKQ